MFVGVLDQDLLAVLKTLVFVVSSIDIAVSIRVESEFMGAFFTLFTSHMFSSNIQVSSFYTNILM